MNSNKEHSKWIRSTVLLVLVNYFSPAEAQVFSANAHTWYQRYDIYPPQCSTTEQMQNKTIPPLRTGPYGESRLQHVTVVMRHGARTIDDNSSCWNGYYENLEPWICLPSTYFAVDMVKDIATELLSFEKVYDALQYPQYNLTNFLPGTCEKGQLLEQGVYQQLANGLHLRLAYIDDQTGHHSKNMQLPIGDELGKAIYFRSDDQQRTLQSGQLLLQAMFGEDLGRVGGLPIHTADYKRDIVNSNEELCPRLAEIRERYYQSRDFRLFNESDQAIELRKFQKEVLGTIEDISDCLITTICSDRELPQAINDYDGEDENTESMFSRLLRFYVQGEAMVATANFAEYSKLASGPLRAEILEIIQGIVNGLSGTYVPPFALFSSHGSTLISIMASMDLFDGKWPNYASMLVMEIHDINLDGRKDPTLFSTDFGFRLIYDGEVITDRVQGCPSGQEICDASKLMVALFYDIKSRNCERIYAIPKEFTPAVTQATEILESSRTAFGSFLLLVFLSMSIGGLFTYIYFAYWVPIELRRNLGKAGTVETDGIMSDSSDSNGNDHPSSRVNRVERFTIDDEDIEEADFENSNGQLT